MGPFRPAPSPPGACGRLAQSGSGTFGEHDGGGRRRGLRGARRAGRPGRRRQAVPLGSGRLRRRGAVARLRPLRAVRTGLALGVPLGRGPRLAALVLGLEGRIELQHRAQQLQPTLHRREVVTRHEAHDQLRRALHQRFGVDLVDDLVHDASHAAATTAPQQPHRSARGAAAPPAPPSSPVAPPPPPPRSPIAAWNMSIPRPFLIAASAGVHGRPGPSPSSVGGDCSGDAGGWAA